MLKLGDLAIDVLHGVPVPNHRRILVFVGPSSSRCSFHDCVFPSLASCLAPFQRQSRVA